ncbi:SDR family oxidoreductase [Dyadobacter subterraneus]|uniref:SDR family NAD(P)-dependent oxidoreductase n=1 Tax=Dyadobacter subterraneus TaxID=2773304 RepID=A0ABR9W8W1_9BACT|nr:SDR family NAD(P)-dependent oxidoreductase [Dyadobacter subterraneus]MBE9461918.1 SDR family NAD(P)-dependent oxidoreductase [Dyadobacter subterraneus]
MILSGKTILITGAGSGIGLDTAKLLASKGNRVIITGRKPEKLKKAVEGLENITAMTSDITVAEDVKELVARITAEFGSLNVLINNAAVSSVYSHGQNSEAFEKATEELLTNYLSVIRLNEKFLPLLSAQTEAAIVNVTSVVSFLPVGIIPTYSDSKAALHSYTITLRRTLAKDTSIRVFELLPPLVNTEFTKAIGGETNGMPPIQVAQALIDGIENNEEEIYVGAAKELYNLYASNPLEALNIINQ